MDDPMNWILLLIVLPCVVWIAILISTVMQAASDIEDEDDDEG
jgi:hypothetical protein